MKKFWQTKNFQLRWNEGLGEKECFYAFRWVLILFGYSIRIHKWVRSDDARHMHNHAWFFWTVVIRGRYTDVSRKEDGTIVREEVVPFKPVYRPANHLHYVKIPEGGCITVLFTGRPVNKWGFWVKNRILRPLRFFDKYGHPACDEQ